MLAHPRRTQKGLACECFAAHTRPLCPPGTGGTTDAQEKNLRPLQEKQRHKVTTDPKHGLTRSGKAAHQKLYSDRAESSVDVGHCDGCPKHGLISQETSAAVVAPLLPGQPLRQPCVSQRAQGIRHGLVDESQGRMLR